jgi:hypothetical protein
MLSCASLLLRSSASSRDSGPPMSRTAFEIGRWLGFVEMEWKRWKIWRWLPKRSSRNPRLLAEYIGGDRPSWKGIAALNRYHLWKSFPNGDHTARIQGHTGIHVVCAMWLRYVTWVGSMVCQLAWKLGLGPDSLAFWLDFPEISDRPEQNQI